MNNERCYAVVAPGLEQAALEEAKAAGFTGARLTRGGVELDGGLSAGMRACLWLRCPTTIRLRLGRFVAQRRGELERGLAKIPWDDWSVSEEEIRISCAARKSRLHHTGMLAEAVSKAAGRRLVKGSGGFLLRIERDEAEVSVDLAGDRLHMRGWRREGGPAPLRETLAAGILHLVGWRVDEPLFDPMCGSGTLPIEAALIARRIAPGLTRSFDFQGMPAFDRPLYERLEEEARARVSKQPGATITGSDRHRGAVASAARNAKRAGVDDLVSFHRLDVASAVPPPGARSGLVVANPPYGARIGGSRERVSAAYEALGSTLKERFEGWRAFVLTPHRSLAEATGLPVDDGLPLDNGGVKVRLFRLRT